MAVLAVEGRDRDIHPADAGSQPASSTIYHVIDVLPGANADRRGMMIALACRARLGRVGTRRGRGVIVRVDGVRLPTLRTRPLSRLRGAQRWTGAWSRCTCCCTLTCSGMSLGGLREIRSAGDVVQLGATSPTLIARARRPGGGQLGACARGCQRCARAGVGERIGLDRNGACDFPAQQSEAQSGRGDRCGLRHRQTIAGQFAAPPGLLGAATLPRTGGPNHRVELSVEATATGCVSTPARRWGRFR